MNKKTIFPAILLLCAVYFGTANFAEASCANIASNLRYGSRVTSEVVALQKFLLNKGYLNDTPSGFFGKLTQAAVKKFQTENGLPSTGLVMSMTRSKISAISCATAQVTNTPAVSVASTNNLANVAAVVIAATPEATPTPQIQNSFSLPYVTTNFEDWKNEEGISTSTAAGLQLNTKVDSTTALARSSKGAELTDYKLSVGAFVRRGTFILISRFKDDKNYVACNFYGKSIDLVQMVNGEQTTLANTYLDDSPYNNFFFNDVSVSMEVKGKTAGCTMMGGQSNVTTNNIDASLMSGAPGVKIWYEAPGVADALVRNVKVEAI